eukprot:1189763-Prorocentrum_minimum.AAC.1
MYTKLSLEDLKVRLGGLIHSGFEHKGVTSRAKLLMVDEQGNYDWVTNQRDSLGPKTMFFDADKTISAIAFLVDNTYVRFA